MIVSVAVTVAVGGTLTAGLTDPPSGLTQPPAACGADRVSEGSSGQPPRLEICSPATRIVEFTGSAGSAIDDRSWNHETGGHGWGNNELQTYTDSVSNSSVDGNGQLRITARRANATGDDGIFRAYTSARISTAGKVVIPPGSYVEAGITAPTGMGVWPAFWLLGSNIGDVGWPAAGELDVLEAFGSPPSIANQRIHLASATDASKDKPYGEQQPSASIDLGRPLDVQEHTYGVYFDATRVQFYVDRQPRLTLTAEQARGSGRSWPFGQEMYIILNVAVGGQAKDPSGTSFPRTMIVSPISIWEGFHSARP